MRWKEGQTVEVKARWRTVSQAGPGELTTGSPYFWASYVRAADNVRLYDNGSGVFATTPTNIALGAHAANVGFRSPYVVRTPPAGCGAELTLEAFHPSSRKTITDIGYVVANDNDDLDAGIDAIDADFTHPDIEPGGSFPPQA